MTHPSIHAKATPDKIWSVILDFGSYPKWIDQLSGCKVLTKSGSHIFVEFQLKVLGIGVQYWIDHTYNKEKGSLTWQLDYSKQSDLDDSTGDDIMNAVPSRNGNGFTAGQSAVMRRHPLARE